MKKLILMLPLTAALFTACGGALLPQPSAVKGTIAGYSGGAATITLKGDSTLATGSVSASGDFTLTLPSASAIAPYLEPVNLDELFTGTTTNATCTGTFTNSNANAKIGLFQSLYIGTTEYRALLITDDQANNSATGTGYEWVYSDQATTIGGTRTCTRTDDKGNKVVTTVTYTEPLKVGWNLVRQDATSKADGATSPVTITSQVTLKTVADQTTTWRAQPAVDSLGLKSRSAAVQAVESAFR